MCCYFDSIIKLEVFGVNNILMDEKSHKNNSIYSISCKTLIGGKPLCIRLGKIDGFIRIYYGARYLILFGSKKYDAILNRIRYLVSPKSSMIYIFSHEFVKIKVDSYYSLPIGKK